MLTYLDLQNKVLRSLDEAGDTGTTQAIAQDYIQAAHNWRVTGSPWPFMLWPDVETFTTVANQRYYPLHQEFHRLLWVRNRGSKEYLREAPFRTLESLGVDWNNDTGKADRFFLGPRQPLMTQPTSASTISIVSSAAGDTTPTVIIRGDTTNGVTTETLTANGTTTVTGSTSFTRILQVSKMGTWTGTLTISAGSTTLLKLFAGERGRSYQQLEMLRLPDAGDVIEYRFFRQPSPLSNDYDLPDIPPPYAEITVYDALLMMAAYNTEIDAKAVKVWADMRSQYEEGLARTFLEGQSIGAEVRYVRFIGDEAGGGFPVINANS